MSSIRWCVIGALALLLSACFSSQDDVLYDPGTSDSDAAASISLTQDDGGKGSTEGGNAITVNLGYASSLSPVSWRMVNFSIRELQVRTTPSCDDATAVRYHPASYNDAVIGTSKATLSFVWRPKNRTACAIGLVSDGAVGLTLSGTDAAGHALEITLPFTDVIVLMQRATLFSASSHQRWFLTFDGDDLLPASLIAQAQATDDVYHVDSDHNAALLPAVRAELLSRLALYRDENGNGLLDAADTLIASGRNGENPNPDDSDVTDVSDTPDDTEPPSDSELPLSFCLFLSPASFDFGSVPVGSSTTQTLRVRNLCTDTMTVSLSSSDSPTFYAYLPIVSIAPNATHNFSLSFSPSVPTGPMTASLLVTASPSGEIPSNSLTIPLSGTATSSDSSSIYLATSVQSIFGAIDEDLNFVRYRDNGTFRIPPPGNAEHAALTPKSCSVAGDCPTGRCESGVCGTDCTDGASDACGSSGTLACVDTTCEWTLPTDCTSDSDCEGHGYCAKLSTYNGPNNILCRSFCSAGNPERYSDTCYYAYTRPIWNGHLLGCTAEANGPSYDHDDTTGYGAERLSWTHPEPGRYRVVVSSYSDSISNTDFNETKINLTVILGDSRQFTLSRRALPTETIWKAADIVVAENRSVTVTPLCAGYTATPCTQTSDCMATYGTGFTCEQNTFGGKTYCNLNGATGGPPEEAKPTDSCTSDADCPDARHCGPIYEQVCACLGGESREDLATSPYSNPFSMGNRGVRENHYQPMDPLDTAAPRSIWCDAPTDTVDGSRTCADLYASGVANSLASCRLTSETPYDFGSVSAGTTKDGQLLVLPSCGYAISALTVTFDAGNTVFSADPSPRPTSSDNNDPLWVPIHFHPAVSGSYANVATITATFTDGVNTVTRTTQSAMLGGDY